MSGQLLVHGRTPGVTVGLSEGQGLPPKQAERRGRSEAPEQGCLGCRQAWGAGRLGGATLGHTTPTAQSALDDPFHWTNWTRCFHYSLCSEEEPEAQSSELTDAKSPSRRAEPGLDSTRADPRDGALNAIENGSWCCARGRRQLGNWGAGGSGPVLSWPPELTAAAAGIA